MLMLNCIQEVERVAERGAVATKHCSQDACLFISGHASNKSTSFEEMRRGQSIERTKEC